MSRAIGIVAALVINSQSVPGLAAEHSQALSLIVNGRATGLVGEFMSCGDDICAMPQQWVALGFTLPADLVESNVPIPLSMLPGIRGHIDAAGQLIYIQADNAALRPNQIGGIAGPPLAPLSPPGYGAVLNYDLLANYSRSQSSLGGLFNLRAFSPYGVLETTGVATLSGGQSSLTRLNTVFTYSDPDRLFRLRLGDVVSGALAWNRAIRLGGFQISSDFNLRPDLITYPLPIVESSTVVPATVTLIANGVRQSSAGVQPGPFFVPVLPVVTGAGEAIVSVQDELGRQILITLPFYASSDLLKPGLTSYSLEAGLIRESCGSNCDHYTEWAASGTARRGITDWLTLESHGEATRSLGMIGMGAVARIGALGTFNFAVTGSWQRDGIGPGKRFGGAASLGFQRITRRLNVSVNATLYTSGYRDTAAMQGFRLPRTALNASFGYDSGRWGVFNLSYISRVDYLALPGSPATGRGVALAASRFRIANASYSVRVAPIGTLYVRGYKDLLNRGSYGIRAGMSFSFGGRTSASLTSSRQDGRTSFTANLSKSAFEPGEFGYHLHDTEGRAARRSVEVDYLSSFGRLTAGVEQSAGRFVGRVGARGALALLGGGIFASDYINDSFAVVRTGDVGGVPVLYENRPIGTTNSRGQLFVPSLLSYQNNHLSLDTSRLPPDIEVGQTFEIVRPRNNGGNIVDFQIRKVRAAVVRLVDRDGRPIPLGSIARIGSMTAWPVGYDGEAYVQDLEPINRLTVTQPDGSACVATFTYEDIAGDIPMIGPVICH